MILAIFLTLFLLILIPTYLKTYGWRNFLWFSDIGLFATTIALWTQSPLVMSIVALAILPAEILWNIDFFAQLISFGSLNGMSNYMFDKKYSLFLRGLSLFHCVLPAIIIVYLMRWGYTSQAIPYSIALACSVLILTYFITDPDENINFVFAPHKFHWQRMPEVVWLLILMLVQLISIIIMDTILKLIFR